MLQQEGRQTTHAASTRNRWFYVLLLLGFIAWIMLLDDIWLPLYNLGRRAIRVPKARRRYEVDVERGERRRFGLP